MGGNVACMGERRCLFQNFSLRNLRERDHLEDIGVDGRFVLKRICKLWVVGLDWNGLAQDRDRWQALVNAVMDPLVP